MIADNNPIIIAAAAVSQKITDPTQLAEGKDAIDLMVEACQQAAQSIDCENLLSQVEQIAAPQGLWPFANPAAAVAESLGATATTVMGQIGVLQQGLISQACNDIKSGDKSLCLVIGGEAKYRDLIASVNGVTLAEREAQNAPDILIEPGKELWLEAETNVGLGMPVGYYALMDSAYRHAHNIETEAHRDQVAQMYADFSVIAQSNEQAWKRKPLAATDIREASDENPMLAFPYTKRHNTSWNVDQASALVICSIKKARELGIDEKHWIYPAASTECSQMLAVSQRKDLGACLGAEVAGQRALELANMQASDIDFVDLYSCFPVAMLTYAEALGLSNEQALTVTGAMPFAGGPLNNYVIQATAKMIEVLKANPGKSGIVSTVSGMMTKQGFGLYRTTECEYQFADVSDEVEAANQPLEVVNEYQGEAKIIAATVLYQKNQAERALVIADTAQGQRCLAFNQDADIIAQLEQNPCIGASIKVSGQTFELA